MNDYDQLMYLPYQVFIIILECTPTYKFPAGAGIVVQWDKPPLGTSSVHIQAPIKSQQLCLQSSFQLM